MLLWTLAIIAAGYLALSCSALGILVAWERRTGNQPDWGGVARVAFGWPLLLAAQCGVWILFRKRR